MILQLSPSPIHLRLSEHQRFTNNSNSFTFTDLQYTPVVARQVAHTKGHTVDFKFIHILSSPTKSSQPVSFNTLLLKSFTFHSTNHAQHTNLTVPKMGQWWTSFKILASQYLLLMVISILAVMLLNLK